MINFLHNLKSQKRNENKLYGNVREHQLQPHTFQEHCLTFQLNMEMGMEMGLRTGYRIVDRFDWQLMVKKLLAVLFDGQR